MTIDVDLLLADLEVSEGFRGRAYVDTVGVLTVGFGHNLETGRPLTKEEGQFILANDLAEALEELDRRYPEYAEHPEPVARALVELCFNMGWGDGKRGLSSFKNTLAELRRRDYAAAAMGFRMSRWYRQVGSTRGDRIVNQVSLGGVQA